MTANASEIYRQLESLRVLIVDDEPTMRKVTRSLLQAVGVKNTYDACDGATGLDAICTLAPDVVLLDWEMPALNGLEFIRRVRSPGRFPMPDVPIIMLTAYGERSKVVEAVNLGVNEFLLKPVSSQALLARLISIIARPRRMIKKGDYYGPEPRKISFSKPQADAGQSEIVLVN
jgi:two-component system, chemotaxis family, chemotaxis protein CheY